MHSTNMARPRPLIHQMAILAGRELLIDELNSHRITRLLHPRDLDVKIWKLNSPMEHRSSRCRAGGSSDEPNATTAFHASRFPTRTAMFGGRGYDYLLPIL